MDNMNQIFSYFIEGFASLYWQQFVMYGIGALLIYLAIAKKYEPMLLLPIGFGAILVNLPFEIVWQHENSSGVLKILFETGIMTELFPLLIFICVGAMIDFRPLLQRPWMLIFGIVAHGGILISAFIAYKVFGFSIPESASIGVIGAADGPTSILVSSRFAPNLMGAITVCAYSYMSLVPIIMPPVIKFFTSKNERKLHVVSKDKNIPQWIVIIFPIFITIIVSILIPMATALIGFLMFGNLVKESGVLEKLTKTAQN
jgi:oxaloacetate decarboxylase beta subunit